MAKEKVHMVIYGGIKFNMKIYTDCEFTGLHKNTTLISIGMVSESGKEFYAEFNDYDKTQVDEWIYNNVIKNLKNDGFKNNYKMENETKTISYGTSKYNKENLLEWLQQFDKVELVLDVGHYDFVLLIDLLFGSSLDAPRWFNKSYIDLNQEISNYHNITIGGAFNIRREALVDNLDKYENMNKHNSLYDAYIVKEIYESFY